MIANRVVTVDFVLGLDIGGTTSAAVLGDLSGNILFRRSGRTPRSERGWKEAAELLVSLVRGVCADAKLAPSEARSLGVSCGGPLDSKTGVVYSPPNLPEWDAVPLKSYLRKELGVRHVAVENDANATALAEFRWGAGQGVRDMAFLTMGTGIGAGLILNGKLYRGRRDLAGRDRPCDDRCPAALLAPAASADAWKRWPPARPSERQGQPCTTMPL